LKSCVASCALITMTPIAALAWGDDNDGHTRTPIKHVIVIIGENRTFDHVYATYKPKNDEEQVLNLLSEGIVKADGTPGPNYAKAKQFSAFDGTVYQLSPTTSKAPYATLPPPIAGGGPPPFTTVAAAKAAENGLPEGYYIFLTTGAVGVPAGTPDTRIHYDGQPVTSLPPGPFQITPGVPWDAYANSPVHRFYQMWQQSDCDVSHISADHPSGCLADFFPWVEVTVGSNVNGRAYPGASAARARPRWRSTTFSRATRPI